MIKNCAKVIITMAIIAFTLSGCSEDISKIEKLELQIDELKETNSEFEDEISRLNSQLENLQDKYEYDEELIQLLQEQLESYGIEPYEL